jgi:hypothetical protein
MSVEAALAAVTWAETRRIMLAAISFRNLARPEKSA